MTELQSRFVDEYLIDRKPVPAALRAGYSPKSARVTVYKVLKSKDVQEAIAARMLTAAERAEVSMSWVMSTLRRISQKAEDSGDYGAATRATVECAKMARIYPSEKLDVESKVTLEQLVLAAHSGESRESREEERRPRRPRELAATQDEAEA